MGVDPVSLAITAASVGFKAIQSANEMKAAKKQGQAYAREGERQALSVAEQTVRTAGSLRNSFLSSGLTLEGGPMDVIAQAFSKGRTDIGRIKENADTSSKNVVGAARSKMIASLASAVAGPVLGGVGDFASGASSFASGFQAGFENPTMVSLGLNPGEAPNSIYNMGPFPNTPLPWSS